MSDSSDAEAVEGSDHAYFQAVEEIFIGLRGAPLLLSPEDYRVTQRWHRQGVPLDVVRDALVEVFEGRRRRGVKDTVSSLRYCARAVDRAWEQARELAASGLRQAEPELEVAPRLAALAMALEAADASERAGAPLLPAGQLEALVRRLRDLEGGPQAVEEALAGLDDELMAGVEAHLAPEDRASLEDGLAAALAGLATRLPAADLDRARDRLRRQLLRAQRGLPLLSLFAPEAQVADSGPVDPEAVDPGA